MKEADFLHRNFIFGIWKLNFWGKTVEGEGGIFTRESCSLPVRIDSQFEITHLMFRRALPFRACANC